MNKNFRYFLIISTILGIIFYLFPEIDLWASGLFYNKQEKFFLDDNIVLVYLHKSVRYVTISLIVTYLLLSLTIFFRKKNIWDISQRKLAYLFLVLLLGPGLLVNSVFKENWGRARPHHVQEFGGNKIFTPAFVKTNQCPKNCSFVSGDVSVGFYFLAFIFAFPRFKSLFLGLGLTLGTAYAFARLGLGAHFLSDVTFAGIFTFTTAYLLRPILRDSQMES